jgi:branched-chain amino acid transport system permease protein
VSNVKRIWLKSSVVSTLFFFGLFLLGKTIGAYNQTQLASVATLFIGVLSVTLLTGASGQISLGQGAIMAVGGYTAALFVLKLGLSMWLAFILAIVVAAIAGLFLGLAAARLTGPYLAGTTLVIALAIPTLANRFEPTLGGDVGLSVDVGNPPAWLTKLLGDIGIEQWQLFVAIPFSALALFGVINLSRSRTGRVWRAIRDNEVAASLHGLNVQQNKVIAFVCASGLAGLAGALYGFRGIVGPSVYPIDLSLALLTGAVIGGLRSIAGALVGTVFIVFLPDLIGKVTGVFKVSEQVSNYLPALVSGVLLLLTIVISPAGLAAATSQILNRRHRTK